MISTFDQDKLLWLWEGANQFQQLGAWTELIAPSANEKFGQRAVLQEIECVNPWFLFVGGNRRDWHSHTDQRFHTGIGTRSPQSNRGAEGKASKDKRQMKFRIEPIERRADVVDFSVPVIVFSVAQSSTTEIEAQHRKTEAIQRLHRMKHDFVV